MKKLLLSALLLATVSSYGQTVKKVVLYDFTGINCQFCTNGTVQLEDFSKATPNTFIPIQIHTGSYTPATSPLKTPEGDGFLPVVTPGGYPAGAVDMTEYAPSGKTILAMNPGYWAGAVAAQQAKTAIASVGIDNKFDMGGNKYEAEVSIKFTAAPDAGVPINVQAFLVEDSIKADGDLRQINNANGPYGGKSPLTYANDKYMHNNVLRKALSGNTWGWSDVIPSTVNLDSTYKKTLSFTIDTAKWVKDNMRIIVIVTYNGNANDEKGIINGEQLSMKLFHANSVKQVQEKVSVLSTYPNPARIGDIVNVSFNINKSEKVTMNVYNSVGQHVATPYVSNDVKGSHTIQWKTGLDNVAPGLYLIEVATPSGKQVQRITLQ